MKVPNNIITIISKYLDLQKLLEFLKLHNIPKSIKLSLPSFSEIPLSVKTFVFLINQYPHITITNIAALGIYTQIPPHSDHSLPITYQYINELDDLQKHTITSLNHHINIPCIKTMISLVNPTKIKHIDLSWYNRTTDISPLSSCINLKTLNISWCNAPNLHSLSSLQTLQTLNLSWSTPQDLNFLVSLQNLKILNISWTPISTLYPLISCPNLKILIAHRCPKLSNVNTLSSLYRLQTLNLSYCNRIIPEYLPFLPQKIHKIIMAGSKMYSPKFIPSFSHIRYLDFSCSFSLVNIDSLQSCPNLRTLDLHNCHSLLSIDSLQFCPNLELLNIALCWSLHSIDPLHTCLKLHTLFAPLKFYSSHWLDKIENCNFLDSY